MAKKKVGIDIGHGENTWETGGGKGVKKNGVVYEEHHFNASVGLIVEKRLKEHGFDTLMAQPAYKNDVNLTARTNKYNAEKCDIVVSIHANAGVATADGACAFYWHTSTAGKKLAQNIIDNFKAHVDGVGTHGNGLHASMKGSWTNLHMVRETHMVAVLVECGFMTNANDFEYIFGKNKDKYVPQVAEAIVRGVCAYFGVKYHEPQKDAPVTVPVAPEGYKVKRGDTLYSIAKAHGVGLQELQKANPNVNAKTLQIGAYLNIPKGDFLVHTITKGDTFYSLADEYGTTVDAIKKANAGVDPTKLSLGMKVNVPVKEKPAPKGDQNTNSIVVYLKSIGQNSSFSNREKLAVKYGINGYKGTAEQNLLLLKKLRGH
jgi:N-acetylmuramoyl-L-alanine amidase